MKEHIEKSNKELEDLNKEVVQLKTTIQDKDVEMEGLIADIENFKASENSLKENINQMAAREAELDMELDQVIDTVVIISQYAVTT